jgi:hypothetical protein
MPPSIRWQLKWLTLKTKSGRNTALSNTILDNFNARYNFAVIGLPHGMPISMEELEALTIEVASQVLPQEDGKISVADLLSLSEELLYQGKKSLREGG